MMLKGHETIVKSLCFSPDGTRLASTADYPEKKACVWDTRNGRKILEIPFDKNDARAVTFSSDGKMIATAHLRAVCVWDAETGKKLSKIACQGGVDCLTYSADGKRLCGAGATGLYVWDVTGGVERLKIDSESAAGSMSPTGEIAALGNPKGIRVWSVATSKELLRIDGHFRVLTFSPDGRSLAYVNTGSIDGELIIQNVSSLKRTGKMP
ncbi:MAG: hypothetical protein AAB288_02280 [Acidobacteriota bacterium]